MGTATILNGLLGGEYLINLGWDVSMPHRDNYDQLLLKTVEYSYRAGRVEYGYDVAVEPYKNERRLDSEFAKP